MVYVVIWFASGIGRIFCCSNCLSKS